MGRLLTSFNLTILLLIYFDKRQQGVGPLIDLLSIGSILGLLFKCYDFK